MTLPPTASEWIASDTIKFETYLGRPAVYINSGVAMSRSASFRNGTLEFDIAATQRTSNIGIAFRAQKSDVAEVLFFRPGASNSNEAMQYAPAINSIAAAWQIYHGPGATAAVDLPREQWIHVRLRIIADSALVYVGRDTTPALVVPRLVLGGKGTGIALWGSGFGQGAYYSNVSYTTDNTPYTTVTPPLPAGTIESWELSPTFDATALTPGTLPDLAKITWESVKAEAPGLVLVNRYRKNPSIVAPSDQDTVLHGRVAGSKVVFARTTIESSTDHLQLLHFGYSDNVVIYCNGKPIFSGIRAAYFHPNDLGLFYPLGDAVYLPLKKGRNEIVYAVTEFFGGWAFSGRLEK